MASDAAALVVTLNARLDTFERQLQRAGAIADGKVREIEGSFSKLNPQLAAASAVGGLIGAGIAKGFDEAAKAVNEFIDRLKTLPDLAKLTGESTTSLYALQGALGGAGGLKPEQVNAGYTALGEKLNDARSQANDLSRLFEANGQKIKDAAGNVISLQAALKVVANLVENAATEFDKAKVTQIALNSASRDWVKALEPGGDALDAARRAAAGAAPDIETLIAKAQAFDAAWRAASENVANYLKAAALSFGDHFQKGLDLVLRRIAGEDYESIKGDPNTKVGKLLFGRDLPGENGKKPKTDPGDGPLTLTVNPGKRTIIPAKGGGGGGSSGPDPDRFFDAQLRRTKERAEDIELETRMLGANTAERIKAKAALDLQQAARRGEVTLTGEQIASLEREAAKLGEVTSAYELARQRQSQSLALQTYAGNELLSVLDQIGQKSATVGQVIEDLARSLVRSAAQAALLGTGPLAGLFGTAAAPGAGTAGGLIGVLFAGIGKNAGGTDNWRGGLSVVGERGPEILNIPRGAQVIPNDVLRAGGGRGGPSMTFAPSYSIDARGSQMSKGEMAAMLNARDAEINRTLGQRLAAWKQNN